MDPVNSPYEKRVDAKHDVLQIYTHVHQNVSRSHDEIGTLHAPPRRPAQLPSLQVLDGKSNPNNEEGAC